MNMEMNNKPDSFRAAMQATELGFTASVRHPLATPDGAKPEPVVEENPRTFAIYVTEIPSTGMALGKVGMVTSPENLSDRMKCLKSAGALFFPIIHAAFEVMPKPKLGARSAETSVHKILANRGLIKMSEIFPAPDGSMRLLAAEVERALVDLGLDFSPIDVAVIAEDYKAKNQEVQERLRGERVREAACPYEAWRCRECESPAVFAGSLDGALHANLRDLAAVGYILGDLMMGSGEPVRMDLGSFGEMTVYPAPSLEAGFFEARAEQHLVLKSKTRCVVKGVLPGNTNLRPLAMKILVRDSLTMVEIAGPLMKNDGCLEDECRFTPEHMACLGELRPSPGQLWQYFGDATRAHLAPFAYGLARQDLSLLPGLRFWSGVNHALTMGIQIQAHPLPVPRREVETKLRKAADALALAGHPVPAELMDWVLNVWLAAA